MGNAFDQLESMPIDKARVLLAKHSFSYGGVHDDKMVNGFLGSLRPYGGQLNHGNFHEVMACLKAVAPTLSEELTDSQTVSHLWGICHLALVWGVDADGMLQRNNLIRKQDVETLKSWVDCISYATMILLEDLNLEEAFAPYGQYLDPEH